MALLPMDIDTVLKTRKPEKSLTPSRSCSGEHHVWLLETACGMIAPALDLIPGGRCSCGAYVIVSHTDHPARSGCYAIAPIHSPAATRMIERHPALKTW